MTSSKVYLITGGNRGIGFELVKELSKDENNYIIATVRDPSKNDEFKVFSESKKNVSTVKLDLDKDSDIESLGNQLGKLTDKVDVFISNAGISDAYHKVVEAPKEVYITHYRVNALAPVFIFQKVYPFLKKSETKKAIFVSTAGASFSDFKPICVSAYASSKAALNFSVLQLSSELANEGFIIFAVHPGMVLSDMGNMAFEKLPRNMPDMKKYFAARVTPITPNESALSVQKVIEASDSQYNGKFYYYDGSEHEF
ncbi:Piso0_001888 [Millerozyma farinosa CBS 7064]|uniref:Piso0_001888 protein n=1 Tax=Pichia sorbitophila (strain ATCC MYA-4447 / BCRC 22081 / CBS 7064 / NBRC 10061 / NRRL Y-12695) TaxID=559304 RepID=G8YPC3_PICSO|nr:Piso0_001888 [Millerozyma farinosa CBS 7064]